MTQNTLRNRDQSRTVEIRFIRVLDVHPESGRAAMDHDEDSGRREQYR